MNDRILEEWLSSTGRDKTYTVIPDGCRDLIGWKTKNNKTKWYISPLFNQCHEVIIPKNTKIRGFRFAPGLQINEQALTQSLNSNNIDINRNDIYSYIDDFTNIDFNISEALECLELNITSLKEIARELGISVRTLQRLIKSGTGRTPIYWKNLARVRKTARDIINTSPNAEAAYRNGYADQAHMCRAIKHWLNITPTKLKETTHITEQLYNKAYC